MPDLASGTRVDLVYCRERVRGTTPSAVQTPVASVTAVATSASGSGYSDFTVASGLEAAGFTYGQWVTTAGFTTGANNGTWKVAAVTDTTLTVFDENDDVVDESVDVAQTVEIRLNKVRATVRDINPDRATFESDEVRESAQVTDLRHGLETVVGTIGFELSREAYDDHLEMLMRGAWTTVTATGVPGTDTVAVTGATHVFTRSGGSWIDEGFRVGDTVTSSGWAASSGANNGQWLITSLTATVMTVYDPDDTMVDETSTASEAFVLTGKRLDYGNTMYSMSIWRRFSDVGDYQPFKGVVYNGGELRMQPTGMVGGTFNTIGLSTAAWETSLPANSAVRSAAAYSPLAMQDGAVFEGGSVIAVHTGTTLNIANNRSTEAVSGSRYSPDIFEGTARITGTFNALFEDTTQAAKFIDESSSTHFTKMTDPDSSSHFVTAVSASVKYTGHGINPGQQGPVTQVMPFASLASDLAIAGGSTTESSLTIQASNSIYTG